MATDDVRCMLCYVCCTMYSVSCMMVLLIMTTMRMVMLVLMIVMNDTESKISILNIACNYYGFPPIDNIFFTNMEHEFIGKYFYRKIRILFRTEGPALYCQRKHVVS